MPGSAKRFEAVRLHANRCRPLQSSAQRCRAVQRAVQRAVRCDTPRKHREAVHNSAKQRQSARQRRAEG
eukprot:9384931-Pyramimonas_sp.AAC.1